MPLPPANSCAYCSSPPRTETRGVWLRTDDGTATFAGALGQVAVLAARLREEGVRHGDLVVVTTRTTPPYLICWLALASIGAVTVPTDPSATAGELAGLVAQVRPRLLVTDRALTHSSVRPGSRDWRSWACSTSRTWSADWTSRRGPRERALRTTSRRDDLAVLIPTSGTTGRSKLVMQTHRAYAMAGEGFPYWMELDRRATG